jgi:hypothetical protein
MNHEPLATFFLKNLKELMFRLFVGIWRREYTLN